MLAARSVCFVLGCTILSIMPISSDAVLPPIFSLSSHYLRYQWMAFSHSRVYATATTIYRGHIPVAICIVFSVHIDLYDDTIHIYVFFKLNG